MTITTVSRSRACFTPIPSISTESIQDIGIIPKSSVLRVGITVVTSSDGGSSSTGVCGSTIGDRGGVDGNDGESGENGNE